MPRALKPRVIVGVGLAGSRSRVRLPWLLSPHRWCLSLPGGCQPACWEEALSTTSAYTYQKISVLIRCCSAWLSTEVLSEICIYHVEHKPYSRIWIWIWNQTEAQLQIWLQTRHVVALPIQWFSSASCAMRFLSRQRWLCTHTGRLAWVGAACKGAFSVAFNVLHTFVKVVQSVMLPNSIAYLADRRVIQQAKVGETLGLLRSSRGTRPRAQPFGTGRR